MSGRARASDGPDVRVRIGAYGCAAGRGRVVRLRWVGAEDPPAYVEELECPACGETHRVALTWRSPTEYDEQREPDLELADEEG